MTVTSESDQSGEVRVDAPRLSIAGICLSFFAIGVLQSKEGCGVSPCTQSMRMRRLHSAFPRWRMSLDRSLRLITLTFAVVYNLLEQKGPRGQDEKNWPNL